MSIAALSPDLVLTNATVLTADAKDSRAEAVAVWNGRIGAVGSARDISGPSPGHQPEAIVLDLVNPPIAIGRTVDLRR